MEKTVLALFRFFEEYFSLCLEQKVMGKKITKENINGFDYYHLKFISKTTSSKFKSTKE